MTVGLAEGTTFDAARPNWGGNGPRPLKWTAWYPTLETPSPLEEPSWFRSAPVARNATLAPSAEPHPLVLLSHGTGGVAAGIGWLGHRLARSGFVALAVDHHGNTGSEPYRAEGFLCLWERAADLSALLSDGSWRERLLGNIRTDAHVAGFSAGAYAALLLMGARVAYAQFEPGNPRTSPVRGPREFPDLADRLPELLRTSAVFRDSWERRSASYRDRRFRAALALAAGRSVLGFSPESLAQVTSPVRITVGDADTLAPADECSVWLHERMSGSELDIVGGGHGHYAFLSEPTAEGLASAPEVFIDPPGFPRRLIHDRVASGAAEFFNRH